MKEVRHTEHLKLRLRLRGYPVDLPTTVYREASQRYLDTQTMHRIAVHSAQIAGKRRSMVVAYDDHISYVDLVTIHPIRKKQIRQRDESGRWIRM